MSFLRQCLYRYGSADQALAGGLLDKFNLMVEPRGIDIFKDALRRAVTGGAHPIVCSNISLWIEVYRHVVCILQSMESPTG